MPTIRSNTLVATKASASTFRDERDLSWHSLVFSSAERESAYVIDGLLKK
jgi:hypothetical protein